MSDINDYEQHFNNLQMKLRTIASTWMLASLGGIAFLLVNKIDVELIFNRYNLINVISSMTVISMFILWLIDQLAYQRLLNSCLVVDLYAEYKDNTKAPLKAMMALSAGKGMTKYYNWFYFLPMLFFTIFSAVALYLNINSMPKDYEFYESNVFFGCFFLLINAVIWIIALKKRKDVPYVTLGKAFVRGEEDEANIDFVDVINNKEDKLKDILREYDPNKSLSLPGEKDAPPS